MNSINEELDRRSVELAIDRLAAALSRRSTPGVLLGSAARAEALAALVAEAIETMDTVRGDLAAALGRQPQSTRTWMLPDLSDQLRREYLDLRKEHEAACAAILDLQEERGAYQRGRADGMRVAAEIVRRQRAGYTAVRKLLAWRQNHILDEVTARVIEDVAVFPDRWRPDNPPPAQPAPAAPLQPDLPDLLDVPFPGGSNLYRNVGTTAEPVWEPLPPGTLIPQPAPLQAPGLQPDSLGVPPNPTEADLDEAAVAALEAIYGTPLAAREALGRVGWALTGVAFDNAIPAPDGEEEPL